MQLERAVRNIENYERGNFAWRKRKFRRRPAETNERPESFRQSSSQGSIRNDRREPVQRWIPSLCTRPGSAFRHFRYRADSSFSLIPVAPNSALHGERGDKYYAAGVT